MQYANDDCTVSHYGKRAAEKNCLSAVFAYSQQPLEMDGSSNSVLLYDGSGDGRVDSDLYSDSSSSGCDTGDGVERYHPNCRKGNRTGGSTGCAVYFESIYTIHCFIAGDSSNVLLLVYNGVGHFDVWHLPRGAQDYKKLLSPAKKRVPIHRHSP